VGQNTEAATLVPLAPINITPVRLGAVYLQSDLPRLAAAIGVGQSKRLIYSAQPLSAARALLIGLATRPSRWGATVVTFRRLRYLCRVRHGTILMADAARSVPGAIHPRPLPAARAATGVGAPVPHDGAAGGARASPAFRGHGNQFDFRPSQRTDVVKIACQRI
jgi:hypothetical protein